MSVVNRICKMPPQVKAIKYISKKKRANQIYFISFSCSTKKKLGNISLYTCVTVILFHNVIPINIPDEVMHRIKLEKKSEFMEL